MSIPPELASATGEADALVDAGPHKVCKLTPLPVADVQVIGNTISELHALKEEGHSQLRLSTEASTPSKSRLRLHTRLRELHGVLAVAASACLFSVMGAGVRYIAPVFPATQTMLARSVIQAIVSLTFLLVSGSHKLGAPEVRCWVLLCGAIGSVNNWIFFFAVTQIPLGDANSIIFTGPVFTAILACCLLGEPFLCIEGFALITSMAGVVLVSRPPWLFGDATSADKEAAATAEEVKMVPREAVVLLCIIGAFLNGSIFIVVRRIGKKAHWMALVFSFSACGIALSAVALAAEIQEPHWPSPSDVGVLPYMVLLLTGLVASAAQSLFNLGMQLETPTVASITRQLDVPLSFLWQIVFFGEAATGLSMLGSLLVLAGTTSTLGRKLFCTPVQTGS